MNDIIKTMSEEHALYVTGAGLLWLANVVRERYAALDLALETNPEHKAAIESRMVATEAMAHKILDTIEDAFGSDFLDGFMDGTIDIHMPSPTSSTVN
jgi:hypothetical protein